MRELNVEEVKSLQLLILDKVHCWCIENDINYWLDCGTLLGAIRHKGFIPWDDDIDVGMLRKDYDRFCSEYQSEDSRYRVVCIENEKSFYQPHAKVIDTKTLMIDGGYRTGVNIDVFVYDNAPDDEKELQKMFERRDRLRKVIEFKQISSADDDSSFLGRIKDGVIRGCLRLIPSRAIVKAMVRNCQKYIDAKTNRVGNFSSYSRTVCNRRVFKSFVDGEFEGKKYMIPIGYDEWLRAFYGDYMKLPPVEKQVSHHSFKAYLK